MYRRVEDEKNVFHKSILGKQEVNVIGGIAAEDIVGWGIFRDGRYIEQHKNPAYQVDKSRDEETIQPIILEKLFKRGSDHLISRHLPEVFNNNLIC